MGVPEMMPVVGLMVTPEGSDGLMLHVSTAKNRRKSTAGLRSRLLFFVFPF
jgi:hypothetical protein